MSTPEMNHENIPGETDTEQAQEPEQAPAAPVPAVTSSSAAPAAPQRSTSGPRPPFVPREERDRRRREALAQLTVGEWREGKVTGIAAFGAFVDLGGVDGLVHVSQLGTGGFVERVEDVVQVGQVVRVRVAEVDAERGRVSLSMREPRPAGAPGGARERQPGQAP
ncbi:MAG TPA: S1 RNA-binding domain-containing protein, partial [Chloroflexota bacterium]|nr:S1 RNA-binding domain-containing protein [Chloroflexota bacterium]